MTQIQSKRARPERRPNQTQSTREIKRPDVNVGPTERRLNLMAGPLLGWIGLHRLTFGGLVMVGLGAMLIRRGWTGNCPAYSALGIDTSKES